MVNPRFRRNFRFRRIFRFRRNFLFVKVYMENKHSQKLRRKLNV